MSESTQFLIEFEHFLCDKVEYLGPRGVLYVLELQSDKWYCGWTQNYEQRIKEHIDGEGCSWTKRYKIKQSFKIAENIPIAFEDLTTILLMSIHGWTHVRGGSYCKFMYNPPKQLLTMSNSCFTCGKQGHFAKNCPTPHARDKCNECGIFGHWKSECPKLNEPSAMEMSLNNVHIPQSNGMLVSVDEKNVNVISIPKIQGHKICLSIAPDHKSVSFYYLIGKTYSFIKGIHFLKPIGSNYVKEEKQTEVVFTFPFILIL